MSQIEKAGRSRGAARDLDAIAIGLAEPSIRIGRLELFFAARLQPLSLPTASHEE
jgi:hypothetical protein